MKKSELHITEQPLLVEQVQSFIESHEFGAQVIFIGAVRNVTKGKEVKYLEFEAYESMAIKEMNKICQYILAMEGIGRVAIYHRVGRLELGELPVIIGVSSPHRKIAFTACQYAIDTLKETVPIWKREFFEDGDVWVSATP
jgi:molybdopterin synthase catalytic subunit